MEGVSELDSGPQTVFLRNPSPEGCLEGRGLRRIHDVLGTYGEVASPFETPSGLLRDTALREQEL